VVVPLAEEGRRQLLDINLKSVPLTDDVNMDKIAAETKGYSGADLTNVCRDASMMVCSAVSGATLPSPLRCPCLTQHIQRLREPQRLVWSSR